ncbi:condensation domain-containing protein [Streptomyces sp. KR80]|uniref:condensation domain-containing protein n=1 Tax=Streptomyces sp. KR80 TaxID=3457426 RepID=UPI003FD3039F
MRSISVDEDPTRLNLAMVFDAPADGGLDRIAEQLRGLLERHEALRTTYRLTTPPTQQVAAEGELVVEVIESAEDPLETAERTARRLRSLVFDLESQLPLRVAVVTSDGVPRHLVWVVTHAAMDVAACELLHTEWAALSAGRPLPPPAALEPIDVVDLEQTSSVKRLGESAVRYWESQLRRVPQAMFTPSARSTPAKSDWLHAGLNIRSRTAPAHLETIAERTGASASAVALAALTVLVGHRTGHRTVVTTSLSGNRVLRKLRDFFGSLAQDALLPVELAELSGFDDAVRQVRSAGLPAYRHSWFDPTAIWQVINGVSAQRGISFARDLVFNDMSTLATAVGSPDQSARSRLPAVWIPGHQSAPVEDPEFGGSITWLPAEDIPCRFFACLYRLEEEFELTLWVDPQILPRDEAEKFGRAMLRLLRAAAEADLPLKDLTSLTTLPPVARGDGWYFSDNSWVELDAVRDLLDDILGGVPQLVTAVPDEDLGHRLVCHLAAPADPEKVHERALAALPGQVTAIAPHTYLVHDAPPDGDGVADPDAWAARPVLAESTGRPQGRDDA